jgi:hypothetical protein
MAGGLTHIRKCKLTVQGAEVDGANDDVIIRLTEDNVPSEMLDANGTYPSQNGGGDVRITSDEAGTTLLNLHIRSWVTHNNPASAIVDACFKSDLTGANQDVWIWYNTVATDSQPAASAAGGSEGVYGTNCLYAGTLDETSGVFVDSSPNGADANRGGDPTQAAGSVSRYKQEMDGTGDRLDWDANALDTVAHGEVYVSMWMDLNSASGENSLFSGDGLDTDGDFWWFTALGNEFVLLVNGNSPDEIAGAPTWTNNIEYHVSMSYSVSAGEAFLYRDAVEEAATLSFTTQHDLRLQDTMRLFDKHDGGNQTEGAVDEVLIFKEAKTKGWNETYYNSWNLPASFITEGTPEDASAGGAGIEILRRRREMISVF